MLVHEKAQRARHLTSHSFTRSARAASLATAVLLGLTACGANESPTATPEVTPAPDAAETAVRDWFEALGQLESTGKSDELVAKSSPDCLPCADLAATTEAVFAQGGSVGTQARHITSITPRGPEDLPSAFVVEAFEAPRELRNTTDAEPVQLPNGAVTYRISVAQVEDTWLITDVAHRSHLDRRLKEN